MFLRNFQELKTQDINYVFLKTLFPGLKCFRFDKSMIFTKLRSRMLCSYKMYKRLLHVYKCNFDEPQPGKWPNKKQLRPAAGTSQKGLLGRQR